MYLCSLTSVMIDTSWSTVNLSILAMICISSSTWSLSSHYSLLPLSSTLVLFVPRCYNHIWLYGCMYYGLWCIIVFFWSYELVLRCSAYLWMHLSTSLLAIVITSIALCVYWSYTVDYTDTILTMILSISSYYIYPCRSSALSLYVVALIDPMCTALSRDHGYQSIVY